MLDDLIACVGVGESADVEAGAQREPLGGDVDAGYLVEPVEKLAAKCRVIERRALGHVLEDNLGFAAWVQGQWPGA